MTNSENAVQLQIQRSTPDSLSSSTSESIEATKARRRWALQLFARFEAASGVRIDEARKLPLIAELELRQAHGPQMKAAEEYILLVVAKYNRQLVLPDFFPSLEELKQIGYDPTPDISRAEKIAYQRGYDAGCVDRDREWEANAEYLKLVRQTLPAADVARERDRVAVEAEALKLGWARLQAERDELAAKIRLWRKRFAMLPPEPKTEDEVRRHVAGPTGEEIRAAVDRMKRSKTGPVTGFCMAAIDALAGLKREGDA